MRADSVFDSASIRDVLRFARLPEPNTRGLMLCPLPGHVEASPSFKVDDSRQTWFCHGQCAKGGGVSDLPVALGLARDRAGAAAWLEGMVGRPSARQDRTSTSNGSSSGRVVATFDYVDESGGLLYVVERRQSVDGKKTFLQRDGAGRYSLEGVRRVPYRLPQIIEAKARGSAIIVCEGEKDVETLRSIDLTATTNAGGSSWEWTSAFVENFRGAKRIVVLVDSDTPGRKAGDKRAAQLTTVCEDVRLVDLTPGRSDGHDVTDWLADGHTKDELLAILKAAPRFEPARVDTATANEIEGIESIGQLLDAEIDHTEFLWEGIEPVGGIALLSSKPKCGKSVFAQNLAIAVARGDDFLGRRCRQGRVLYLAMEERRETLLDRLRALGATADLPLSFRIGRAPQEAMAWLLDAAKRLQPSLVIIDTLVRLIRLEDIERYGATSNALEPLLALSREHGIAQLWLHHNNKAGDTTNSVSGSNAIVAAVDTTIIMRRSDTGMRSAFSEQRIGEDMEETVLEMDPDTYRITAAGSRSIAEQRGAEKAILERLDSPTTREDIARLSGHRLGVGRRAAAALIDAGLVRPTSGTGRRGDPKLYIVAADGAGQSGRTNTLSSITSSAGSSIDPDEETKKRIPRPDLGTKLDEADEADARDEADEETRTPRISGRVAGAMA